MSSPTQFKINEAFAIGNLDGNHTKLGVACTVKTVEQDTGIYINHFIVVNFTGFENMVAALGGVYECNPTPINDPNSDLHLSAGQPPADPGRGARLRPGQVHPGRRQRPGAHRPSAGVHVVAGQPGAQRALQPAGDLPVP